MQKVERESSSFNWTWMKRNRLVPPRVNEMAVQGRSNVTKQHAAEFLAVASRTIPTRRTLDTVDEFTRDNVYGIPSWWNDARRRGGGIVPRTDRTNHSRVERLWASRGVQAFPRAPSAIGSASLSRGWKEKFVRGCRRWILHLPLDEEYIGFQGEIFFHRIVSCLSR